MSSELEKKGLLLWGGALTENVSSGSHSGGVSTTQSPQDSRQPKGQQKAH